VAFVGLLGWSIEKPSAGSRDASIHRGEAIRSPFEFPPLVVRPNLNDRDSASRRVVYPYSIIPGGAMSAAELRSAMAYDPVVAAHYAGFAFAKARVFRVQQARAVYVSYRKGDDVFWTSKKLRLAIGETLITDGQHISRTRCGNQISELPHAPVSPVDEPVPETLDTPLVSQIIQPFVAPITGEIAVDGAPVGALPFVLPGAGGRETTEESSFLLVPMIPITGSEFSPSNGPPPTPTPEPSSLILFCTGLGVACLFRKLARYRL
jgi:hypothetical protein